jgi:hypothetical protein
VGPLVVLWDRGDGFQSIDNRQDDEAGKCQKMRGFGENLPRNLLIYCAIFLSVTFRSYSTDTPFARSTGPYGRVATPEFLYSRFRSPKSRTMGLR